MQSIPSFSDANVLVVGDVMLDRYWHGDTGRISPEAPVPVVRIGREELRLGGAGNVALNLASIGVNTTLIGVVGDDEPGRVMRRLLADSGIEAPLVRSASHPTIVKLRVISSNQQLIRLDFEEAFDVETGFDQRSLRDAMALALPYADAVIFSDYGKGTLNAIPELIAAARAAGKPVLVDPKGVDWARYRNASVVTPNLSEFEAVVGQVSDDADLAEKAEKLRAQYALDALLVTRSERGMSLFLGANSHHMPAHAQEVFDVTGAGDTVIAMLGAGLAAGESMASAAGLANLAAGVVVAKLGTATASLAELRRAARSRHNQARGLLDEDELLGYVEEARAHGERVVMTNGCFDILHPGHIQYLEAARALGDWLIVAVNADASVRRLKGESRPINELEHRMAVLKGLSAVDWVVPFVEDTPERLICKIKPDLLVKGGDYAIEDIAGADCVQQTGGQVRVLEFVDGYSTSRVIERIQSSNKQT